MDVTETGPLADCLDPSVRGPTVEPLAVVADEDRSLTSFADGQIHRACGSWDERDHGGLVAFAEDPKCAMPPVEAEVADVGVACLADSQAVEFEEHGQRCALVSEVFGGEDGVGLLDFDGMRRLPSALSG